ncbi:MAG: hypothetical protein JOY70_03050 [Acidisphaera sp.]|nr:hypothetical protein [Acidisphaera sp.]MBV9812671.1 hypothetical protein [Acetobacteraceae bacterium]
MALDLQRTFGEALLASGPALEYADRLALYGQFVGDWTTRTRAFAGDSDAVEETEWDVRFDWVLEGRAIQDVWITPPRRHRRPGWHEPGNRYSTTLRLYDPQLDAWHILWANPPNGVILRQLARQVGDDIVQDTVGESGDLRTRWVYREITSASFRWCNEVSSDGGASWTLVQEMRARRTRAA